MKLKYGILKTVKTRTGTITNMAEDMKRDAMPAGKRRSKSGKIYWETRRNRSDARGLRY